MTAVQIFLGPPTARTIRRFTFTEARKVRQACVDHGIVLVVHGKYIYNPCDKKKHTYQSELLMTELHEANQLGADVVIHQGKNMPDYGYTREQALYIYGEFVDMQLNKMRENHFSNRLLLENSCHEGNALGWNIEDLKIIYDTIAEENRSWVGFTVDTCHLFQAGICNFKTTQSVDNFLEQFDSQIGLDKLNLIHLNDSKMPFNKHIDRHWGLFLGYIGNPDLGGSVKGLSHLVRWASEQKIPMICETPETASPRQWQDELEALRDLIGGSDTIDWYFSLHGPLVLSTEVKAEKCPPHSTPPLPTSAPLPTSSSPPCPPPPAPPASAEERVVFNPYTERMITPTLAERIGIPYTL